MGKLIIFSAPSGSGKTTIVHALMKEYTQFEFSISATTRPPRGKELNGVDYHFFSLEEFKAKAANNEFVEWEEVYPGCCYGTLKSELERIWAKGNVILFDVDVMGGINLKKIFGADALSVFVMPPSVEELRRRLIARNTDSEEMIAKRVAKAASEIEKAPAFDKVIINDRLEDAIQDTRKAIDAFLKE